MYVHPVIAPGTWSRLGRADLGVGFAVVNVADGPGAAPDPVYQEVLAPLVRSGVALVGYVDTGYGERDPRDVLTDVRRWSRFHQVTGVFLDRVVARPGDPRPACALVERVRSGGASRVVVNPGVQPARCWFEVADVVVTFEGTWADHRDQVDPREQAARLRRDGVPARTVCHLVHTVPAQVRAEAVAARIAAAGVGIAGVSHAVMPNPWTGGALADRTGPPA